MKGGCATWACTTILTLAVGYHLAMERRAESWRPSFERAASQAGYGPVDDIDARIGGCGWRWGETISVRIDDSDDSTIDIRMCRNRDGSGRVDFAKHSHFELEPSA